MSIAKREPVGTAAAGIGVAITTVIGAGVALINAFHPGAITQAQSDALIAFVVAVWALLGLVWLVVRPLVTPVRAPRLVEGADVTLHDGGSGVVVRK